MMSGIESPPTDDYSGSERDGDQSQYAASTTSDDEEDENDSDLDDINYEQCGLGEEWMFDPSSDYQYSIQ